MSKGIFSLRLSVSILENAPQVITILSNLNSLVSVLKTGFSLSNFIFLIFDFSNFPPFFKKVQIISKEFFWISRMSSIWIINTSVIKWFYIWL